MNDELEKRMHSLMKTHKKLKHAIKTHQSEHTLRYGEFGVMASVIESAQLSGEPPVDTGVPMKKLSDDHDCTPAMITKIITSLEERGLVRRELSTDDRRGVKVCVTPKGYDVWQKDHMLYHKTLEAIGEKMGMEDLLKLFELTENFIRCNREIVEQRDTTESNNG